MADPTAVNLRLVYLARLREVLGLPGETFTTPAPATVATVLEGLRARGGNFAVELAAGRAVRVAVNHAMAVPGTPVRDGDEVALFPPVTGG
jgi:molybdopterin synthase sulfur carrier subunit